MNNCVLIKGTIRDTYYEEPTSTFFLNISSPLWLTRFHELFIISWKLSSSMKLLMIIIDSDKLMGIYNEL
jgi:anthranilate/para-aminobenzoate synthase component II